MKLLYLALLASLGAHASESYVIDGDLLSTMDTYSRSANLQPLKHSGGDELRVWTRDYMGGRIEGFSISKIGAVKCRTTSNYTGGIITIDRARCRRWHKGEDAIDALDALSALNGKEWDCPLFDGGAVFVEGLRNGRRFAFSVSNPSACDDSGSKAVVDLLDRLW